MTRPIVLSKIAGGSILTESNPLDYGLATVYRGADLSARAGEIASGPRAGVGASGPYRKQPAERDILHPVPVIVRIVNDHGRGTQDVFEHITLVRHRLSGTATPRLFGTLGRDGRALVTVEEHISGTSLETIGRQLRKSGKELPVEVVLAIGRTLLSLWIEAALQSVDFMLEPSEVRIDARGAVRALPRYSEERARQAVGAALFHLSDMVSYSAPEMLDGNDPNAQSAMFCLGLLLYEMLAGRHPILAADTPMWQGLTEMRNREIPHLRQYRRGLHPAVTELVHRCLARNPDQRFASFRELQTAYLGVTALFPETGPTEITNCLRTSFPDLPTPSDPEVIVPEELDKLPHAGYAAVPLPKPIDRRGLALVPKKRIRPVLDADLRYPGTDARPMYEASKGLLIDARPVTKAEMERYFIATWKPVPSDFAALGKSDDDACTAVTFEMAEEYARWAGKRLPTEAEWEAAVTQLGSERLGTGEAWEWTSTPHETFGHVIRGGAWRDQPGLAPEPDNRSFSVGSAPDLGFRCVIDEEPREK